MRRLSVIKSTFVLTTCLLLPTGFVFAQATGGGAAGGAAGGAGGAGAGAAGSGGLGAGGVGAGGVGSGGVGGVGGTVGGTGAAGGLGGTTIGTAPASGALATPGAVSPTGTVPGVVPGTGTATTTPGGGVPKPVAGTPIQSESPGVNGGRILWNGRSGPTGTGQSGSGLINANGLPNVGATSSNLSNGAVGRQMQRNARFGAQNSTRIGTNGAVPTGTTATTQVGSSGTSDTLSTQLGADDSTGTGQGISGRANARTRASARSALNRGTLGQGTTQGPSGRFNRRAGRAVTNATPPAAQSSTGNNRGDGTIRTAPDIKNVPQPGAGTATTGIPALDPSTNTLNTTNPAGNTVNDAGFEERNQDPSLSNDFSNPSGPLFNDRTPTATSGTAGTTTTDPGLLGTTTDTTTSLTDGNTGTTTGTTTTTGTQTPTQVTAGFRGTDVGTDTGTLGTTTTTTSGANLNSVVSALQSSLGLQFSTTGNGLSISQITPGGLAETAGLQTGDQIVTINGQGLRNAQSLFGRLRRLAGTDQVTLNVMRNGQTVPITMDISTLHSVLSGNPLSNSQGTNIRGTFPPATGTTSVGPTTATQQQLGTTRVNTNANLNGRSMAGFSTLQTNLGLQFSRVGNGLTVQRVTQGGQAALAGLQSGDQIISLNGQNINSGRDLLTQLRSANGADQATLMVQRNGQSVPITLDLSTLQSLLSSGPTTQTQPIATPIDSGAVSTPGRSTLRQNTVPRTRVSRPGSFNQNP